MCETLNILNNLKIDCEVKTEGSFTSAVIGKNRNIKVKVCNKFYTVTVCGKNNKCISKNFNHDSNLINSIIEMQKLASLYM